MSSSTDRIEKRIVLRAPQERVWHAISDAKAFGEWFGMDLDGPFAAGKRMTGRIKPTVADPDIAKMQEKYTGKPLELHIERIEPMRLLSFRWHPFAIDDTIDYSHEPMTLVTFRLEPVEGGTALTVSETGFDALPIARRNDAFEANDEGWVMQLQVIEKYLLLPQP